MIVIKNNICVIFKNQYNFGMISLIEESSPILHTSASVVSKEEFGTPMLEKEISDMFNLLEIKKDGVALAAPQVGIAKQIFIITPHIFSHPDAHELVYINPQITSASKDTSMMEEGCLSVPYVFGKTKRSIMATVRAQRRDGTIFEKRGTGLLAQIFQHEIDHLHGILFNSHADNLKKLSEQEIADFEAEDYKITPIY